MHNQDRFQSSRRPGSEGILSKRPRAHGVSHSRPQPRETIQGFHPAACRPRQERRGRRVGQRSGQGRGLALRRVLPRHRHASCPQPRRFTNNSGCRRPPHRQPHHGRRLAGPNNSVPARPLPSKRNEAKRLKQRSWDFALVEGQLYKKGISQPMLKCITETEGIQILHEVHSGTCGSHSVLRALAAKVIRQGFYWPAIICTANRVTRSCEACQKFSPLLGSPSQFTKLIAHT
jgi:hypothetical protein